MPLTDLCSVMHAFPIFCSTIGEALGADGRGLTTAINPEYQCMEAIDLVADGATD